MDQEVYFDSLLVLLDLFFGFVSKFEGFKRAYNKH